jgi:hypothetical protein
MLLARPFAGFAPGEDGMASSRARRRIVVGPSVRRDGEVSAPVAVGSDVVTVTFRVRGFPLHPHDDAFVPVGLLLGMALGMPVVVEGPVSGPLVDDLRRVRREVLGLWDGLTDVPLEAPHRVPSAPPVGPGGVLCFFSGGLDSFYSLLSNRDVTHVVFVNGFDVPLGDRERRARVGGSLRAAAADLGKTWVEAETDLRALSDRHVSWGWYYDAGIAAVSLLLSASFREILHAAPLTDARRPAGLAEAGARTWDNGLALVRRDGGEATRPEKARLLATDPTARRYLRVCWQNRAGAYNCGSCSKCLHTMVSLELAGGLSLFPTFPSTLDLGAVGSQRPRRWVHRVFLEDNLRAAQRSQARPELIEALRASLAEPRWRRALTWIRLRATGARERSPARWRA